MARGEIPISSVFALGYSQSGSGVRWVTPCGNTWHRARARARACWHTHTHTRLFCSSEMCTGAARAATNKRAEMEKCE